MDLKLFGGFTNLPFSITERKGLGHPDTLCDGAADYVSQQYSQYCLEKFGEVLHHNCDKFVILGGTAKVGFGYGKIVSPFRFIMNGRFSESFGATKIEYKSLIRQWIKEYVSNILTLIDSNKDMEIVDMIHSNPSPGIISTDVKNLPPRSSIFMFTPRNKKDLTQSTFLESNDTSAGVGYAPLNTSDLVAIAVEKKFNSKDFKIKHPYIGSDIKVMVVTVDRTIKITTCIPFIGLYTPSIKFYKDKIKWLKEMINDEVKNIIGKQYSLSITINNRDVIKMNEVYLTATGSSVESGDEGIVGRGNRINGVISMTEPMSMEAACGKNPIYHIGKLYNVLAKRIAFKIYDLYNISCKVYLVSQTGRDLQDPWQCIITLSTKKYNKEGISNIVKKELSDVVDLSNDLIFGRCINY
ncbi:MAG: methionine adenosyltransferase [Patescibacteria group bacterium]